MGRKKGIDRPHRVELTLSDDEMALVREASGGMGLTVAEFLRRSLFPRVGEQIATIAVVASEVVFEKSRPEQVVEQLAEALPDEPSREYPPCQNCKNYRLATCGRNCPNRR